MCDTQPMPAPKAGLHWHEALLEEFRLPGTHPLFRCELLMAAMLIAAAAAAQSTDTRNQPPERELPTLTMTTRLVVLDVVVTDKAGHIVSGLAQQDFTVDEDSEPQTIRSFEAPAQHLLPPGIRIESTADLAKAPDASVTILVLDELNTRFEDMAFARHSLEKYLKSQPAVLPQPAALLVVGDTKFGVLLDYSRDRQALLEAVARHFPDLPNRLMQSGKSGTGTAERLAISLGSLEQIAQATSGHPGRKNVIWVGRGFPAVNTNESTNKEAAVIQHAVQHVINALRDARITLSMIDPTINEADTVEIATPDDLDAAEDENGNDPFAGNVNFQSLAPATGGRVFLSRNDVDAQIASSVREGSQYYTLSYSPTNHSDLGQPYRRIRIKIDRPGVTATTRNGYYIQPLQQASIVAPKDADQLRKKLAFDLGSAANSNIAYTGLTVNLRRLSSGTDVFVVSVDSRQLTWRATSGGSLQAEVTLAVASFSSKKRMLARTVREVTAQAGPLQPQDSQPSTTGFTIAAPLPADAIRVRFVVRDAVSGNIGTVDFDPARR
jgi:VWFA-related protein